MTHPTLHGHPITPELVALLCDADLATGRDIAALRAQTLIEDQ